MGQEPDRTKVEMETPSGRTIEVYRNICHYCEQKLIRKYFGGGRDVDAVMKALKAEGDVELPDGKSLEELL
jgi:hypothetical protein